MLVSRVAAPPVLSRDLHSRIRCVSRVTSAHRFAAIAGRRPTTRRPGLPGSTRSHRSRREALQLESLPFPAVSRQLFAPGRKFEIAIRIVKEQCQRRVRHDSDPVLTPGNEKAPVGEPTGAFVPSSGRFAVCAFRANVRKAYVALSMLSIANDSRVARCIATSTRAPHGHGRPSSRSLPMVQIDCVRRFSMGRAV